MIREKDTTTSLIAKVSAVYICYFGLREPLVQTQVLPYLREIRDGGARIKLLTFEPEMDARWTAEEIERERERLAAEGIGWVCLPYHKRPSLPATVYDIVAGARLVARMVRRDGIDVLHARSHVGAAIGALAKRLAGGKLIFDIRGFMPEEYTDAGRWKENGYVYRLTKRAERDLMRAADGFVVLTEKAREILFPGATDSDALGRPVEVIPCCVDFARFDHSENLSRDEIRRELNLEGRRVIVYLGALGGWYMTDETAKFLAIAHRQDGTTFSLILTQSDPEMITVRLRAAGIAEQDYIVRRVPPSDVPRYLRAADFAVSFIKPCFSKLSSSPTKIAEYLAAGLPVVSTAGIGDVDEVIEGDRVGTTITNFDDESCLAALRRADELRREDDIRIRCRESARRRFDLARVGGEKYRRLYRRVLGADVQAKQAKVFDSEVRSL